MKTNLSNIPRRSRLLAKPAEAARSTTLPRRSKVLAGFAAAAIILGACGSQSEPSPGNEQAIENDSGQALDLDVESGDISVETDNGSVSVDGDTGDVAVIDESGVIVSQSGDDVIENWRSDLLPLYPGAEVTDAVAFNDPEGRSWIVTLSTNDSPETVNAFYVEAASRFDAFTSDLDGEYFIVVEETDFTYTIDLLAFEGATEINLVLVEL